MPENPEPTESSWQRVCRVMDEADVIEKLARLYREGGVSWEEAMSRAIKVYEEANHA